MKKARYSDPISSAGINLDSKRVSEKALPTISEQEPETFSPSPKKNIIVKKEVNAEIMDEVAENIIKSYDRSNILA